MSDNRVWHGVAGRRPDGTGHAEWWTDDGQREHYEFPAKDASVSNPDLLYTGAYDPTDSHSLAELRQHLWNSDDLVSHCRCEVCDDYVASHSLREVFRGDESWLACIPCWEYETGRSNTDGA